jgi:DNA polymerase phi
LLFEETKGAKKRKAEELEPVEVLADLLISFLAKNSAMMRTLSSEVFKVFAPKFTPKVLEIIFEVDLY